MAEASEFIFVLLLLYSNISVLSQLYDFPSLFWNIIFVFSFQFWCKISFQYDAFLDVQGNNDMMVLSIRCSNFSFYPMSESKLDNGYNKSCYEGLKQIPPWLSEDDGRNRLGKKKK